jgi:hypothetical protein
MSGRPHSMFLCKKSRLLPLNSYWRYGISSAVVRCTRTHASLELRPTTAPPSTNVCQRHFILTKYDDPLVRFRCEFPNAHLSALTKAYGGLVFRIGHLT